MTAGKKGGLSPRKLVYGGLAVIVLGLLVSSWYLGRPAEIRGDSAWLGVDFASKPEVDLLRRYIRVDTSTNDGSERAGAEFLAAELEAMGLEPHIEQLGGNKANLWAVLEGKSPEALVLHNHIDVSPSGPIEDWDFPPFDAVIDQFWLYGRGAFDMKSVTVAQLLALKELAAAPEPPQRSVIFLATGSEEIGSELGTRWILDQHPELRDRFWAVLSEGGVLEPKSLEDIKYWGIEFAQKQFMEGSFCAATWEELDRLASDITTWSETFYRPAITPEVREFLEHYASSRENATFVRILAETSRALEDPTQFDVLPDYLKALFRNELHIFEPTESPGGGFVMRFFIHLLPGSEPAEISRLLLPEWLIHGRSMTLGPALGANGGSPTDHPVFRALRQSVSAQHPDAPVGPFFLCFSATDSRFFRQAGIPAYGFSPFVIFNTDTFRKDNINERIGLPGYVQGVELYVDAIRRIVG